MTCLYIPLSSPSSSQTSALKEEFLQTSAFKEESLPSTVLCTEGKSRWHCRNGRSFRSPTPPLSLALFVCVKSVRVCNCSFYQSLEAMKVSDTWQISHCLLPVFLQRAFFYSQRTWNQRNLFVVKQPSYCLWAGQATSLSLIVESLWLLKGGKENGNSCHQR